jgi:RNA polymerase sigma factor (sigma-70 family)
MQLEEFEQLLDGCRKRDRISQKRLYQHFYSLGMSVTIRYAKNRQEAEEICQDGFVKVFSKIQDYAGQGSFQGWLRRIFIRSAIDYFRKYRLALPVLEEIDLAAGLALESEALDRLSIDEKLHMVQRLSPAYRLAFNLYAVEGYTTAEIAGMLDVAEGTVRANLAKARLRLQMMIRDANKINSTV